LYLIGSQFEFAVVDPPRSAALSMILTLGQHVLGFNALRATVNGVPYSLTALLLYGQSREADSLSHVFHVRNLDVLGDEVRPELEFSQTFSPLLPSLDLNFFCVVIVRVRV